MATIRLVPSTYSLQSSSYFTVSNAANCYTNVDSTTYATFQTSSSSTSSRYFYLKGFNFDDLPSAAVVSSFTVKIHGRETGANTSTSYAPSLCNNTTVLSDTTASENFSTSEKTITIPTGSLEWEDLVSYGDDFAIRVNARRSSRNTASYIYVYGAEIEVVYTVPTPRTVTSTLSGNGTIDPSGAVTTYDGEEYILTITPTNKSDTVTASKDGTDITSQLVAHGVGSTISAVPNDYTTSGIQSGSSYAEYCVGHSAESPSSSGTSSNMYSSSGSTGHADYSFDFSEIPSNATIENVEVRCYGHRESSTIDSSHVSNVAVYVGNTSKVDDDFPSTSNSIVTLTPTLTRSELDSAIVRHTVGYYGGLVLGITFEVTYSTGSGIDHYTYTYTVSGNATIAVVIGGASGPSFFVKQNGTWVSVSKVYQKVNGSWVQVSDISSAFSTSANYVKGN